VQFNRRTARDEVSEVDEFVGAGRDPSATRGRRTRLRKRFLVVQHLEEAVFPLRCNPQLVRLPCEVATVADGEVVAISRCYSAAAAGSAIATSTSVSENVGALPRSA
jgi:hypothetical protein